MIYNVYSGDQPYIVWFRSLSRSLQICELCLYYDCVGPASYNTAKVSRKKNPETIMIGIYFSRGDHLKYYIITDKEMMIVF